MEKDQKILIGLIAIVFVVASAVMIYLFAIKKDVSTDALKFKSEYETLNDKTIEGSSEKYLNVFIDNDNVFKYKSDEEIVNVLKSETALIYFGFAKCPYCRSMVALLNKVAREKDLENIYYVDILNNRDTYETIEGTAVKIANGTSSYYKILGLLDNYLSEYYITDSNGEKFNTGVKRLYAPTVVAVQNGKIVGFHEGTVDDAKYNQKLTDDEQKQLKSIYSNLIDKMNLEVCENKSC